MSAKPGGGYIWANGAGQKDRANTCRRDRERGNRGQRHVELSSEWIASVGEADFPRGRARFLLSKDEDTWFEFGMYGRISGAGETGIALVDLGERITFSEVDEVVVSG